MIKKNPERALLRRKSEKHSLGSASIFVYEAVEKNKSLKYFFENVIEFPSSKPKNTIMR
jgi:hypothetical protein